MPSLVQIKTCRLFGAKPLSEPMLAYLMSSAKFPPFSHGLSVSREWTRRVVRFAARVETKPSY